MMDDKIAYLFREKRGGLYGGWFGLCGKGIIPTLNNTLETARELRRLGREGYAIHYINVPLEKLTYMAYRYRDINDNDKAELLEADREIEHRDNYPGLFREEAETLTQLEENVGKEAVLYVFDTDLYPPERLAELRREMGLGDPRTTWRMKIDDKTSYGRIDKHQYATLLTYFKKVLTLRNATNAEAQSFTTVGRPLLEEEVLFLQGESLTISLPD